MFMRGFFSGTVSSLLAVGAYNFIFSKKDTSKAGQDIDARQISSILKYGIPDTGSQVRTYSNHVLSYDRSKRTPAWVAELITKQHTKGNANRKHAKFKPDPDVDMTFSAVNSDYLGSGWSRGHMAPAGNNKHDQKAMQETFYLSNIVPQNLDNNAGFWNRFEIYCRDLTNRFEQVQIISGPLVLPMENRDGKQFVNYEVIGENQISVPTHLYKIIIVEDRGSPKAIGSFIVPNKPISFEHSLREFQVPVQELQKKSGIVFFPKLDVSGIEDLCSIDTCGLMKKDEFELYFISRRLQGANNLTSLEKAWRELELKHLKPTKEMIKMYETKKQELNEE